MSMYKPAEFERALLGQRQGLEEEEENKQLDFFTKHMLIVSITGS